MSTEPVRNLKLTLAYDGSDFHGWQRQPGVRTVQQTVEETAMRLLGHPLAVVGASRTDAGVHARGQVASLRTHSVIPDEKVCIALRDRLPPDVGLIHLERVPDAFHATRDALGKCYRYRLTSGPHRPVETLSQRYVCHVRPQVRIEPMRDAASRMIGTHDFAGFATQGSPRATTVRTVWRVDVRQAGAEIVIDVEGDGFLYNQVRNMVGTLIEIGRGHWPPQRVDEILASADRSRAGPTAPAHGLCLEWVRYDPAARSGPPAATADAVGIED